MKAIKPVRCCRRCLNFESAAPRPTVSMVGVVIGLLIAWQSSRSRGPKRIESASERPQARHPLSEIRREGWSNEERNHHRKERWFWGVSVVVTFFAALGAGVSAVLAWQAVTDGREVIRQASRQADFAKDQAEAARGQVAKSQKQTAISESANKPYILPIIKGDRAYVIAKQVMLTESVLPFADTLSFENFGTTPAIVTRITVQFALAPQGAFPRTEYHTTDLILEAKGRHDMHFVPPLLINLADQNYRRLVMGEIAIFLQGEVSYMDVAGTPHLTRFCFAENISGKGDLRTGFRSTSGPGCVNRVS